MISKLGELLGIKKEHPPPTLITLATSYTNKKIFRDMLSSCQEYIYWVDKYFSKAGLDLLIESSLDQQIIKTIKLLSTMRKLNVKFRKLFKDFKEELENKGINVEMRILLDPEVISQFHDR